MDLSCEKKYHLLEETNWLFVARRKVIGNIIKKLNINSDNKILKLDVLVVS